MAPIPLTHSGPADGGNYEYRWQGDYVHSHLLTDVGKKRRKNEDACILCAPEDEVLFEHNGMLFAVADGMGGASAGELASHLALDTAIERYYATAANRSRHGIPALLREALSAANSTIFSEASKDPDRQGMGTTVSAVVVRGDCCYVAQVGDSRVYVSRGRAGGAHQLTDDHSLVAERVRNGYLSEEEARKHSLRNLITRAVGIKTSVDIDLFSLKLQRGDTILICSDGLSNLVEDEEIGKALEMSNLQGAARLLVGRALTRGGTDNITVALLRIVLPPPKREMDPGAQEVVVPVRGVLARIRSLMKKAR